MCSWLKTGYLIFIIFIYIKIKLVEVYMSIVEVRNLNKSYPAFRLEDVSFDINEGEITGFIGRNGAGKTTTIKSMLNLIHPNSGEISYFGRQLKDNETEIKKLLGYSTGSVTWYPRKRIKEIIQVVKKCYDTWDEEAYRKYLESFELDENKTALELSEGMKVKCNLLIALSHRARVLILDEPTSGLDPFSRDELLSLFKKLRKEGVAIFFSTHIVSDLEICADHIVYIANGKIVASLPKAEFVGRFSKEGESLEETILRMERGGTQCVTS